MIDGDDADKLREIEQHVEAQNDYFIRLARWILDLFGAGSVSETVATLIMVVISCLLSYAFHWLFHKFLFSVVHRLLEKANERANIRLLNDTVLHRLSFIPSMFVMIAFGVAMRSDNILNVIYMKVVMSAMAIVVARFLIALANSVFDGVSGKYSKMKSFNSVKQLIVVIVYILAIISVVSIVADRSPATLLTGLGASAAVMTLIFQDTIKGLVAGVQLSANNMLAPGDWVSVPKHNANGIVMDVNINTVKIRNWDNTITTIPPMTLMQDSFNNWKGMQMEKGRRMTPSVSIDMQTVRFLTKEEVEAFRGVAGLEGFFARLDKGELRLIEGELTNMTLFREYMSSFLAGHRQICKPGEGNNVRTMVRYLSPTQYGLPVEVYCFSRNKKWEDYEEIRAGIIDQMIASMNRFGLRPYQVVSDGKA